MFIWLNFLFLFVFFFFTFSSWFHILTFFSWAHISLSFFFNSSLNFKNRYFVVFSFFFYLKNEFDTLSCECDCGGPDWFCEFEFDCCCDCWPDGGCDCDWFCCCCCCDPVVTKRNQKFNRNPLSLCSSIQWEFNVLTWRWLLLWVRITLLILILSIDSHEITVIGLNGWMKLRIWLLVLF